MGVPHRRIAAAAAATAALVLTAACGDGEGNGGDDQSGGQDQIIIDLLFDGQEASVDPHRAAAPSDRTMFRAMYDTLVTFPTADLSEPQPWLATEWSSNDDATEWTFQLRDDVTFSTGNDLTSEDVVWSLNRLKNVGDRASYLMDGLSVRADGDYTVVVESEVTNVAVPFILTSSNAAILDSEELAANGGTADESAASTDDAGIYLSSNSVGSGPYQLERYEAGSELVMTRNEQWWGNEPAYEQIVLRDAEPAVQRLNVSSGDSDIVVDLGQEEIAALGETELQVATSPGTNAWVLVFNLDDSVSTVTSSADFREAARMAIDWEALAELGGDGAQRHCGFILPTVASGLQEGDEGCIEFDVDGARSIIEDAGLDGETVTLTLQAFDRDGVNAVEVGSRIAQMWQDIGINAEIVEQPDAVVADLRNSGQIEVFIVPNSMRSPHPYTYVGTMNPSGGTSQSGESYRGGWQAADQSGAVHEPLPGQTECAALGVDGQNSASMDDAVPLYEDWQRCMNEVSPFIPLIVGTASVVAQPDLPEITDYHPLWAIDIPTYTGAAIG
ncbi:ABC transporter substrate-binding protein [Ruania rhizosphaerae]|uniref:ABC transporter substrate-binding protein n=1 Tax=Ruania rhizosphaerae TaxID=1840413 RepID=UPI0013581602|nr:ABC transporter substrate-binding protein [Ruania rhizosphaerae]